MPSAPRGQGGTQQLQLAVGRQESRARQGTGRGTRASFKPLETRRLFGDITSQAIAPS